jgi:hypothetical protein
VAGARRGWFDPVSDRLGRACGLAALAGIGAVGAFAVAAALAGAPTSAFLGGRHWASLATAAAEGVLSVNLSVWVLGVAQRHLNAPVRTTRPGARLARGAYAAFVIQGHVLVGLALAVRPLHLWAEPKGLLVSVLGVVLSFWLGWLLVAHTPLGRIL